MSVKIKINWDNENVVSEFVRIYRADSAFTTPTQAMIIATIIGDVYEYEDLDVVKDQTYFYMLSAKLGEQEAFTECFEVKAVAVQGPQLYIVGNVNDVILGVIEIELQKQNIQYTRINWTGLLSLSSSDVTHVIAPRLATASVGYSSTHRLKLVDLYNQGVHVMISVYGVDGRLFTEEVYAGTFGDLNTSSVTCSVNGLLQPPYNTSNTISVRNSSYYSSILTNAPASTITLATVGSSISTSILQKGEINNNAAQAPSALLFAGWVSSSGSGVLTTAGKSYLSSLLNLFISQQ